MKEIVSQPTNGVICEDGKIAKNGLRVICPFCGEIGLSQGRGGSVNVWTVGAIERRECTKCRKQFHTIALTVPPDMTPEDFYSAVRAKWTITTQERNALVETHLGCIWWTINKNRRLISAAGLDDEDVFQQLAIRIIRAVENYDPDKGKDLEQHIFAQLQYEVLNCKDAAKLYGIKGAPYGARDLTVSLDALVETGVQFCGGGVA